LSLALLAPRLGTHDITTAPLLCHCYLRASVDARRVRGGWAVLGCLLL